MKKSPKYMSGFAVETVILVVALVGGAGWFGMKEIKHAVKDMKQEQACKDANDAAAKAKVDALAAQALREKEEELRLLEKKAFETERDRIIANGRSIQRSSLEGVVFLQQFPVCTQRDLLGQRLSEINYVSETLFGVPDYKEAAKWKQTALDALEGKAAALADLAGQAKENEKLRVDLAVATKNREEAEKQTELARAEANAKQKEATAAAVETEKKTSEASALAKAKNAASTLANGLLWVVAAVAGVWLIGSLLKVFAFNLPAGGFFSKAVHTAANTFNAVLAPTSRYAEVRATRELTQLVENTGTFVADLRRELPAEANKVTPLMDVALSPEQQRMIRDAFLSVKQKTAAEATASANTPS